MWEKSKCFDRSVQRVLKETPTSPETFWSPHESGSAVPGIRLEGEAVCVISARGK